MWEEWLQEQQEGGVEEVAGASAPSGEVVLCLDDDLMNDRFGE